MSGSTAPGCWPNVDGLPHNLRFTTAPQAEKAFENLASVLEAAGTDLSKLVKVNVYVTNKRNFPKIVALREPYFTPPYLADTIVEVSATRALEIEIEAIALAVCSIRSLRAARLASVDLWS